MGKSGSKRFFAGKMKKTIKNYKKITGQLDDWKKQLNLKIEFIMGCEGEM